jgi:hypothetical protein
MKLLLKGAIYILKEEKTKVKQKQRLFWFKNFFILFFVHEVGCEV